MSSVFNPNRGGVQMTTTKLGSYYRSRGHDVFVYSLAHENNQPPSIFTFECANESGRDSNPNNVLKLNQFLNFIKPDVIINQKPYEPNTQALLSKYKIDNPNVLLLGCLRNSLFATKNNLDLYADRRLKPPFNTLFKSFIGRKLLLLYHKYSHSKQLKDILHHNDYFVMFGPPNKLELDYFIGNNYDGSKIKYFPNTIPSVLNSVPKKDNVLLYVGRLDNRQKRADLILPIWKTVSAALPDWELLIVGYGPYEEELKKEIKLNNISRVSMLGRQVPDEYYKRAKMFIMPSAFEGFPNVLIEAQSFGCVPFAFDNFPMLSWIVKDNENAILAEPFNHQIISDKIIELANNPSLYKKMSEKALTNAKRFTIDTVGDDWLTFFKTKIKE